MEERSVMRRGRRSRCESDGVASSSVPAAPNLSAWPHQKEGGPDGDGDRGGGGIRDLDTRALPAVADAEDLTDEQAPLLGLLSTPDIDIDAERHTPPDTTGRTATDTSTHSTPPSISFFHMLPRVHFSIYLNNYLN